MADILLPRHVIERLENRWASRLEQDVNRWNVGRSRPIQSRRLLIDGGQVIPVVIKRAHGERLSRA